MKFACGVCWDYECNCTESDIQEHREKGKIMKYDKEYLDKNFLSTKVGKTAFDGRGVKSCMNCMGTDITYLDSMSWSSTLDCNKCGCLTFVWRADGMSGNNAESYFVYVKNRNSDGTLKQQQ